MIIRDSYTYGFDGKKWIPIKVDPNTGAFISSDVPWTDKRFDWTTGDLDYKGFSTILGAPTDGGDYWHFWKYAWTSGLPTRIQYLIGNWDDRATLDWA